jgi:hypothetical protein
MRISSHSIKAQGSTAGSLTRRSSSRSRQSTKPVEGVSFKELVSQFIEEDAGQYPGKQHSTKALRGLNYEQHRKIENTYLQQQDERGKSILV